MPMYGVLAILSFAVGAMAVWTYFSVSSMRRAIRMKVVTTRSEQGNDVRTRITVTNTGKVTEDYVVVLVFITVHQNNPVSCDIVRTSGLQPLQPYELERKTKWETLRSWAFVYTIENMDAGDLLELELRSRFPLDWVRMIATSSEINDSYSRPALRR